MIAIATVAAVGVLVLDHYMLDPLIAARGRIEADISAAQQRLEKAQRTFAGSRRKRHLWADMQNRGLQSKDESVAEGQVLNNIRDWAQDAGLGLSSVKPERSEKEKGFQRSSFRATATGGMREISRFLWYVQTADLPIRINDLQITSRKEGTDDLSLQLGLSTVFLPPNAKGQAIALPGQREVEP